MNEIYCADMTMLIAGSSRLSMREESRAIDCSLLDPEACESFECLVTIICNNTRTLFQKPGTLVLDDYPLISAWQKTAKENDTPVKLNPFDYDEMFDLMGKQFAAWLSVPGSEASNATKLASWVAFQFSDSKIREQFVRNTNRLDLPRALDALKRQPTAEQCLTSALRRRGVRSQSSDLDWANSESDGTMEDIEYALAYAFWAFAKGFRYSAGLPENNSYAVHWLREAATTAGGELLSKPEVEVARRLFPWGAILNTVREWNTLSPPEMAELLGNLRGYTIRNLTDIATGETPEGQPGYTYLEQFIGDAITKSRPLGRLDGLDLELAVQVAALVSSHVVEHPELADLCAEQIVEKFKLLFPWTWFVGNEVAHRVVRVATYKRDTLRTLASNRAQISAICEAKGWIKTPRNLNT